MQALLDAKIKVPEEVSIMGFNDVDACNFTRPTLSTVYAPSSAVSYTHLDVYKRQIVASADYTKLTKAVNKANALDKSLYKDFSKVEDLLFGKCICYIDHLFPPFIT